MGRVLLVIAMLFASSPAAWASTELWQHQQWLKLGRWEKKRLPARYVSNIITEDFFLAEDGRRAPEAELDATLAGLVGPLGPEPDGHALCRYPGRALFLDREMQLGLPDPFAVCPELRAWSGNGSLDGVSVLFVAGYFANPGSAFGHLLLRLHTGEGNVDVQDVLDNAINYGARQSEEDGMIPYIYRGLTGRYQSTYSTLDFYHHNERFREEQLRDIWQYRLDLSDGEVRLLSAHIWELLRTENRYYFLLQNCGYRIAELLELVIDRDLVPHNKFWAAPVDVFHALGAEDPDAGPAISAAGRLPSRETAYRDGYRLLGRRDRRLVDAATSAPDKPLRDVAEEQGAELSAAPLNVLVDYYAFQEAAPTVEARKAEVLAARFQLPPDAGDDIPQPVPPHEGQPPSMLSVTVLSNDELGEGIELRARPAYFDFLSATEGTAAYAELSMADLRLVLREDNLHLRQLEIVRVASLGLAGDGAPNRPGLAFRTQIGVETLDLTCDSCLLGYAEASFGEAVELMPGLAVYGLAGGRLEGGDQITDSFSATAALGTVFRGKHGGIWLEAGFQQGIIDTDANEPYVEGEIRLRKGVQSDFGLTVRHEGATEIGLAFRRYW
ncbi:DUF4105 domain-containing protein [Parvularcula sp. ZS-1/3]|uniref:DUF4105 domain-containing protein n=1 Tax=Parvularcula mediterranea TaxID=2732508 RepID=A0A7Y3RNP3_9PROT|nr:DUF4105 domain-containing protein [Parvularcula mediterranea]NNU17428.1 DUF4105 domain-containing protein [Parvularcula mediterranea]